MKPFEGVVHGAHGKPLQIAGKTQHLNLQWGEARGRASFIVIVSEAIFYICRDTYFSTLFGVCPTFRSRITAIILFFIFYVDS